MSATDSTGLSNVIYVGHLPFGFFEDQIWMYFSQFGRILHVRVSRNPKTGKSRHYGWVEFADSGVASIAAETMNGYMLFKKTLVCEVLSNPLPPNLFMGPGVLHKAPESRSVSKKNPSKILPKPRSLIKIKSRKTLSDIAEAKRRSIKGQEARTCEQKITRAKKQIHAKMNAIRKLGIEYNFPIEANKE